MQRLERKGKWRKKLGNTSEFLSWKSRAWPKGKGTTLSIQLASVVQGGERKGKDGNRAWLWAGLGECTCARAFVRGFEILQTE